MSGKGGSSGVTQGLDPAVVQLCWLHNPQFPGVQRISGAPLADCGLASAAANVSWESKPPRLAAALRQPSMTA